MTIKSICEKFGGTKTENEYSIKTKVGTLIVTDREYNTFIPMYFKEDFNLQLFLETTFDTSINHWSFKWNLLSNDGHWNLKRLNSRLEILTRE